MSKFWKIAGIATLVAVLGVVSLGAVAYAQDDGSGGQFDFGGRFREAVAGILGISVEKYDAAVEQAREQVVGEALDEGWLTEDQAERMLERFEQGFGRRGGMERGLMGPHMGFMGHGETSLVGVAAEALDMSVEDLHAELKDGKTIAEVAEEKGVDPQEIIDAYLGQLEENLAEAVEEGKITQNMADWMLEQAMENVPDQLENTWEGRFPGGKRPGGMPRFPGGNDA
jgi:lipoate-protein ligase A